MGLGRVLYDQDRKIFRMWYGTTGRFAAKKGGDRLRPYRWDWSVEEGRAVRRKVDEIYGYSEYAGRNDWIGLYAESPDGIHWTKPNLGLAEFQGSRDNNILPAGEYVPTHYDPYEPDPDKRYKKVVRRESSIDPKNDPGLYAWDGVQVDFFHSPDGINWDAIPGQPPNRGGGRSLVGAALGRFPRQLGPHREALRHVPGELSASLLSPGDPGHRPG